MTTPRGTNPYAEAILDAMSEALYVVDTDRRITFWNAAAEQLTGYRAEDVVGRRCRDGLLNHVDDTGNPLCTTSCPLLGTISDGALREAFVFLHHREGHRMPVQVRASALHDAEGNIIGAVEAFHDDSRARRLADSAANAEHEALTDPLTGIANRRQLERSLDRFASDLAKYGSGYAVLFVDVDHFKSVNDELGHDAGDDVLTMVARTLRSCVRGGDVAGRWGGEEFLVLAASADEEQALALAERLRRLVGTSWMRFTGQRLRVTVSVGVALAGVDEPGHHVVERADLAMLAAKRSGRDRVRAG